MEIGDLKGSFRERAVLYRARAEWCRQRAAAMPLPDVLGTYLEMAEQWDELARQAETLDGGRAASEERQPWSDRDMLIEHLDQARRHIAEGQDHIARQRNMIAELERDGHNTDVARALLTTLIETQRGHEAHCSRIEKELSEL